jgi:hypothetical protein
MFQDPTDHQDLTATYDDPESSQASGVEGAWRLRTLPARWHTDPDVSDTDLQIGEALLTYHGSRGAFPRVRTLAGIIGKVDRTVQRRLRHLESLGLVRSDPVFEHEDDPLWIECGSNRTINGGHWQRGRQTNSRYALIAPGDTSILAAQTRVTSPEDAPTDPGDIVDNVTPPGDIPDCPNESILAAQTPVTSPEDASAMSPLKQPVTNPQPVSGDGVLQPARPTGVRMREGSRGLTDEEVKAELAALRQEVEQQQANIQVAAETSPAELVELHRRELEPTADEVREHAAACRRAIELGDAGEPEPVHGPDSTGATPFDDLDPDSDLAAFESVLVALEAAGFETTGAETYDNDDPRLARRHRRQGDGGAAWRARWAAPSSVLGGSE